LNAIAAAMEMAKPKATYWISFLLTTHAPSYAKSSLAFALDDVSCINTPRNPVSMADSASCF
ncbi:hypothetical protein, partial [Burkholderia glumae]|uniref:hypothetical protein n=1 Tax=Burkholderia glumae TaxID=337 RepID=UPI002036703A